MVPILWKGSRFLSGRPARPTYTCGSTRRLVADMFTKQIFPKHFERLRRVMMGHENFDDMCERYQDAKAAGDNVDDPKLYTVKPVRPPNG